MTKFYKRANILFALFFIKYFKFFVIKIIIYTFADSKKYHGVNGFTAEFVCNNDIHATSENMADCINELKVMNDGSYNPKTAKRCVENSGTINCDSIYGPVETK